MFEMAAGLYFAGTNHESRSALPGAPVVQDEKSSTTRLRSRLATLLHRAAWRIEPPQSLFGP